MQTPKARSSLEVPRRVSPRAVRQLKTTVGVEPNSASSSNSTCRTPKERTPKIVERLSPRNKISETVGPELNSVPSLNSVCRTPRERIPKVVERLSPKNKVSEKKHPSRISELESWISQLQEDLKKTKDELSTTESLKKQAELDTEESRKQIAELNLKLKEYQTRLSTTKESCVSELQNTSQEQEDALQFELEAELTKHTKSTYDGVQGMEEELSETLFRIESMKDQLKNSEESESHARALASETLVQLENAKKTVEALRSDGVKANEAYNSIYSELEDSRARVNKLEVLVRKLEADLKSASTEQRIEDVNKKLVEPNELEELRSALEVSEARYHEDQIQNTVQIRSAYETVERIKSELSRRETELEVELRKSRSDIEELKANLMDKETELQAISEENEGLHIKLEKKNREYELDRELRQINETVYNLKGNLMDKETELQNILEENEALKIKIGKMDLGMDDNMANDLEASKAAEREAIVKLGILTEEANKSSWNVSRLTNQLDAAQSANAELEAELRKIKVQSDQWRKAAEAAAAILGNNGKYMERTGSLVTPPYYDDMDDDDLVKKKNGNVLKKIGVLWKKPQK